MSQEPIVKLSKKELRCKLIKLKELSPRHWNNLKEFRLLKFWVNYHTQNFNKFDSNLSERVYAIIMELSDRPKCYCGGYVSYKTLKYSTYCSNKCMGDAVEISNKKRRTSLKNFGVEYPSQSQIIKDNKKQTMLKNFGVEYPSQCEEIFEKQQQSSFKKKEFVFPSGRVEYVQGYEPQILEELIKHFDEDDIVCGSGLPEIWYASNKKKHRYYPDIYIKSNNTIIEVKSTYTMRLNYDVNLLKQQACLNTGYNFWFVVGK